MTVFLESHSCSTDLNVVDIEVLHHTSRQQTRPNKHNNNADFMHISALELH